MGPDHPGAIDGGCRIGLYPQKAIFICNGRESRCNRKEEMKGHMLKTEKQNYNGEN
jgi:hypothetical protein